MPQPEPQTPALSSPGNTSSLGRQPMLHRIKPRPAACGQFRIHINSLDSRPIPPAMTNSQQEMTIANGVQQRRPCGNSISLANYGRLIPIVATQFPSMFAAGYR